MSPTERFVKYLRRPAAEMTAEELALLIAAHAHCALDVDDSLRPIDRMAAGVTPGDLGSLRRELFERFGLRGNATRYHDAENSFLDSVISTGRGIPISLSVLTVAIGRRAGIGLDGVGMPGHFLVAVRDEPGTFIDPFDHGRLITIDDCASIFAQIHGEAAAFDPAMLAPVDPITIAARMLNNLLAIFRASRDHRSHLWVARLRTLLPMSGAAERADLAIALAESGQFDAAAAMFDELAHHCSGPASLGFGAARDQLRSRLN